MNVAFRGKIKKITFGASLANALNFNDFSANVYTAERAPCFFRWHALFAVRYFSLPCYSSPAIMEMMVAMSATSTVPSSLTSA